VTVLGEMGPPASAGLPGVRQAMKDRSENVRLEAAIALWRISGKKEESQHALKLLQRQGKGNIRVQAVEYLCKIEKNREQLDMLVRLIEEGDRTVSPAAVVCLLFLGEESREVLPAVAALTRHRSLDVRRHAFTIQWALTAKKKEPR
jgi:HEAT repeat protein